MRIKKEWLFIFIGAIIITVIFLSGFDYKSRFEDMLVEAHGFLFDIILFGVLLAIYDKVSAKKRRINSLLEELEDFRPWEKDEAGYRIIGIFKRLRNMGVKDIDLSYCHLNKIKFDNKYNYDEVNFAHARMQNSSWSEVDLTKCNLLAVNFEHAQFSNVNFSGVNLQGSNMKYVKFIDRVNFSNANLENAELNQASYAKNQTMNLHQANLKGAFVEQNWLQRLKSCGLEEIDDIKTRYEVYFDQDFNRYRIRER